jgi:hypothetical protein
MTALKWTTETPTKPGWYWEYHFGYARVIEVYTWTYMPTYDDPTYRMGWANERLWVTRPHTREHPIPVGQAFAKDTQWAGPLEAPS